MLCILVALAVMFLVCLAFLAWFARAAVPLIEDDCLDMEMGHLAEEVIHQ
jgi:hypothetical protein